MHMLGLVSLFPPYTDRKKVVEVTLLPADIEVLETVRLPNYRRNFSYFVRKFRQIKVSRTSCASILSKYSTCIAYD